jgi:molybdenum cofactor synthesis domain-containing protein
MKVAILTISDKGFRGEREDRSGPAIRALMENQGAEVVAYRLVPDEKEMIKKELTDFCDQLKVDVVLTTGGTGLAPRDITPEATLEVVDRLAPGFVEAMRSESLKVTRHAMLSRAVSGVRGQTLIINLPGSEKAVRENLSIILPALPHAVEILQGKTEHQ